MATKLTPRELVLEDQAIFQDKIIGAELYEKQQDMVRAVFREQRVTVSGANGTGKDFTAARIALQWLSMYAQSKVIVIAPTHRQVETIFWNELRAAYSSKRVSAPWGFRIFPGSARIEADVNPHERFGIGFATRNPAEGAGIPTGEGLQGYHSPHLLAIISEAHGVQQSHIDEIRRLNPQCLLMTGNPFSAVGEFYDSHHSKSDLYYVIQISAFDTPNLEDSAPDNGYEQFPGMVNRNDAIQRRQDWGENNPLYIAGVLGKFPENLSDQIIVPLSVAKEAASRMRPATGPVILGVDIADTGEAKTVWTKRQGLVSEIVQRYHDIDTMETVGKLRQYISGQADLGTPVDVLVIDSVGIGLGTYNRLMEIDLGITRVVKYQGGARANNPEDFVDQNAECYWRLREYCYKEDGCIPDDPSLLAQLSGRRYNIQSDKRTRMEPKNKMAKSPDEADSLAMTFVSQAEALDGVPLLFP